MKKTSYAIFGMGKFGRSLAEVLLKAECEVMVIDRGEEGFQDIGSRATYAICADVTEPGVLENIGINNVDVVVIAMSGNMEANLLTAIYAKKVGVPQVIAKCSSALHGTILEKIGVDRVISPEYEAGKRLAKNLLAGDFADLFELSDDFSMVEVNVPQAWEGKTLSSLRVRDNYKVNVVAVKEAGKIRVKLNPNEPMKAQDVLIVLGENKDLHALPH